MKPTNKFERELKKIAYKKLNFLKGKKYSCGYCGKESSCSKCILHHIHKNHKKEMIQDLKNRSKEK